MDEPTKLPPSKADRRAARDRARAARYQTAYQERLRAKQKAADDAARLRQYLKVDVAPDA